MKKLLQSLFLLMFIAMNAMAQDRTITGSVISSDDKLPLPGVSVKVQDVQGGAMTDANGKYSLRVPAGSTILQFTYLGYATQSLKIGASNTLNVVLVPNAKDLSEVVVTALGLKRTKRDLGYSTQNVKGEQLVDRGDNNFLNALQGKIAGVEITGASGSAGSSTNIILRGMSSLSGSNQPLFVVDGIPISNDVDQTTNTLYGNQPANRALDIDPNNIESLNVLQGPAAAALYGSRASAGAIIITTKKGSGQAGRTDITVNSAYGVQNVYGFPKLQNEFGQGSSGVFSPTSTFSLGKRFGTTPTIANGLIVAAGTSPVINGVTYKPGDVLPYINYPDNFKTYFAQGHTWDNNISIISGDAKNNYAFSASNSTTKGILPASDFDKVNIRFSAGSQLTKKLNLNGSANYFNTFQNGATTQGNGANSSMFGIFGVTRSTDLAYYRDNYKNADGTNNWFVTGRDNPYFAAYENSFKSRVSRFLGNVSLSYDVLDWLNVSYRLGLDTYTDRRKRYVAIGSTQAASSAGSVTEDNFFRSELNGDLLITAKKQNLFTNGLNATALIGQNINQRDFQNATVSGVGLTIPDYTNVANGQVFTNSGESTTRRRLLGYYGQVSLGYNNYLFLELTGRFDQSSTLPVANNTYFYPSVSTSFVFTDALKIKSDILSIGKIRASYAKVGKDANTYVLDARSYSSGSYGNNTASFSFPYGPILGFGANSSIGNPDLKPEFTNSYELGLNLGLFKDRVNLDATIYKQGSKNQIVSVALPASTGYGSRLTNIGEVSNKGIELLLSGLPIKTKDVTWEISANFSKNKNKVISIAPGVTSFAIAGNAFSGQIPTIYEGYAYGVIVGSKYPRSPSGDLIVDKTTGLYSTATIPNQVIADPNKQWTAGLTNTVRYKNFTFSGLVDFKKGGDVISWTAATLRSNGSLLITAEDREQPHILPGVIQNADGSFSPNNIQIPGQTYWNAGFGGIGGTEFNVFDATTFRLREITIGYDLTGKTLKSNFVKNIRLTVYGRNLYYYAPNSPIDPEVSTQGAGNIRGLELQSAPNTRNFGASLRVTF
ncbi:SusC/RagA family TonB-linked outer membrane protein [Pedobacter suwonensis]|uniref:SusC/RagA family TonB-linked outer membrane protein n=1 Tax=Pedobacter suwonensis TaxID=332999 RepID=UPI0025CE45D4|nr:SusC/RagA family TonB-linked outer membrane protein [uncultured Pedobacter sp.]